MAIHWQLKFRSLRRGTDYTVNIYDDTYSGIPVVLKGGAEPFTTQEDNDENLFIPIRTQSGYLRIVDDGYAADGTTAFDWHDILPATDTSRPVTLTHIDGQNTIVDWQGFMQAQDFGSKLYGNPQTREYPIQCPLTVTQGEDINYQQKGLQNFAYLLKLVVDTIPSICRPQTIVVQGGDLARSFLTTKIDWQTFVTENDEEDLEARCTIYEAFEGMCKFWGWTARFHKQSLYLMCPDDESEQMTKFLTLTQQDLTDMAGGSSSAGTTSSGTYPTYPLSGTTLFASINNDDFLQRGNNKAKIKADVGEGKVLEFESDRLEDTMEAQGWEIPHQNPQGDNVTHTNDLLSLSLPLMTGSARSGYGSMSMLAISQQNFEAGRRMPVLRIKKTMESRTTASYVSLETVYDHCFSEGYLQLTGAAYVDGIRLDSSDGPSGVVGNKHMYMRLGIGPDRASALWWTGDRWGASPTESFAALIGGSGDVLQTIGYNRGYLNIPCEYESPYNYIYRGKVFIDIIGSDDVDETNGERAFDLADFGITFSRRKEYNDFWRIVVTEKKSSKTYKSDNGNEVKNEFNEDMEYASDANLAYGYKLLISGFQYLKGFQYVEHGVVQHPEQHLANRVTAYGATSKRRMKIDVRNDNYLGVWMSDISPQMMVRVDGTKAYPISISHNWRDDITTLVILEIPES